MDFDRPLDRFLGSPAQLAVLRAICALPTGYAATGREIARRAGVSHPQEIGVLSDLTGEGFVQRQRVGRADTYRLNASHVLADLICDLFKKEKRVRKDLISFLRAQVASHAGSARAASLFGGAAEGPMRASEERLSEIKGRKSSDILADPQRKIPEWELEREYRSTYREQIVETEKVTAGKWIGRVDYHSGDVVPISLDREIAKDLRVNVGDELVFDVQGIPIRTRIASLRSVDWKRFQTNFFVVFPAGVLEAAPTFHVLVSRARTPADSARLQNAIVSKFPNVSALDLAAVIQTVDSILSKVALVIRVMSLFTVAAGLIVVASAIWSGRYQRVEESVLLRTLGASRRQIWQILGVEYFLLGFLASLTGTGLAVVASWALATFVFKLSYAPTLLPLLIATASATTLTVLIGLLTSRGVSSQPPLEVLRAEVG